MQKPFTNIQVEGMHTKIDAILTIRLESITWGSLLPGFMFQCHDMGGLRQPEYMEHGRGV